MTQPLPVRTGRECQWQGEIAGKHRVPPCNYLRWRTWEAGIDRGFAAGDTSSLSHDMKNAESVAPSLYAAAPWSLGPLHVLLGCKIWQISATCGMPENVSDWWMLKTLSDLWTGVWADISVASGINERLTVSSHVKIRQQE